MQEQVRANKFSRLDEDLVSESQSEYVHEEKNAYTLVMIVNPNPIYEQICQEFKYQQEQSKNKKILLSKVVPQHGGNGYICNPIRAQTIREADERGREHEGEVIG